MSSVVYVSGRRKEKEKKTEGKQKKNGHLYLQDIYRHELEGNLDIVLCISRNLQHFPYIDLGTSVATKKEYKENDFSKTLQFLI